MASMVPLYLKSCGYNPGINWLIIGNSPPPTDVPPNVAFLTISFEELLKRVSEKLGIKTAGAPPYKLCDFKPAYGEIFEKEIEGYDFFGWGDIDLVYGQFEKLIAPLLEQHEIISTHSWLVSNHTFIMRRTPGLVSLFRQVPNWQERMETPLWSKFDDVDFSILVLKQPKAWLHECSTTPHGKIPWADGSHRFPTCWTWNRGVMTNNHDSGYQLAYFHFMVWKAGRRGIKSTFKQWPPQPLVNFTPEDFATKGDTYTFTKEGISFRPMKPVRKTLPFLYDDTAPKRTTMNKLLKRLQRTFVGYLGQGIDG